MPKVVRPVKEISEKWFAQKIQAKLEPKLLRKSGEMIVYQE